MEDYKKEVEDLNNKYSKMLIEEFKRFDIVKPEFIEYLIKNKYFIQPASTKYHGVYPGALFIHSKNVADKLIQMTKEMNLKWNREESPYIIGYFHDLCKMDQYIYENGKYYYNNDTRGLGHGDRSVMLLSKYIDLTEEEKLCITYHMGAYETNHWNEYDNAIRKYENVLWSHTADMYASKIMERDGEK